MESPQTHLTDHDLLIRLDENVREIKTSMKEMRDGVTQQLAEHDLRIKKLEEVIIQTNPIQMSVDFHSLQKSVEDGQIRAKTERRTWGLFGGFAGGIVSALIIAFIIHFIFK